MQALSDNEGARGLRPAAPITAAEKAKAEARIRGMRRSLKEWLKFRTRMDDAATGKRKAKVPVHVLAKTLPLSRDWALEQRIAVQLHALLSEMMDANQLPSPDVSKDPNAAVKLANIAISGGLPAEVASPVAQGIFWLWPAAIVVGMVLFTIMSKISSDADVAKEKERLECIKAGACTDAGFWLKMGGVAVLAWVAWDKFGLKELAGKARRKAGS